MSTSLPKYATTMTKKKKICDTIVTVFGAICVCFISFALATMVTSGQEVISIMGWIGIVSLCFYSWVIYYFQMRDIKDFSDETDNIFEGWGRSIRYNDTLCEESDALKDTIHDLIELLEVDDRLELLTKSNEVLEQCLNKLGECDIKKNEILNEYKDKEENG